MDQDERPVRVTLTVKQWLVVLEEIGYAAGPWQARDVIEHHIEQALHLNTVGQR